MSDEVVSRGGEAKTAARRHTGLRRQFLWTLPANFIYGGCQWLLLIVINKWGSPAAAGEYGLALAVTAPVFMFANLRLSTILATEIQGAARWRDYFRLRCYSVGAALSLVGAALLLGWKTEIALLLVLLSVAKSVEALSELCCGLQQRRQRMDRVAVSLTAQGLLTAGAFSWIYVQSTSLTSGMLALLAARLVVLLSYDLPMAARGAREAASPDGPNSDARTDAHNAAHDVLAPGDASGPTWPGWRWSLHMLSDLFSTLPPGGSSRRRGEGRRGTRVGIVTNAKAAPLPARSSRPSRSEGDWMCRDQWPGWAILRHALPLGITALLVSLTSSLPRYLIGQRVSVEALGIFCSLAAVMQAGTLVFRALEQPAAPRMAALLGADKTREFWRLLSRLLAVFILTGSLGCGLSLLVGPWVLGVVFTPEYVSWSGLLALMIVATTVGQIAGIVESALIAARITVVQLPMHACTTIACLLLALWWIPIYGLYGAVGALIFCRFPFISIGVWLLRRWATPKSAFRKTAGDSVAARTAGVECGEPPDFMASAGSLHWTPAALALVDADELPNGRPDRPLANQSIEQAADAGAATGIRRRA